MVDFVCLFFKHKTAYEMRISDWSSDVCSSDLFPELQEGVRVLVTVDQSIDGARLHRLAGALCARLARLRRLVVLEGMRALARRPRVQPGIPTLRLVADRGRCRLAPGRVVVTREAHGLEAFRAQGAGGLPPPARGVLGALLADEVADATQSHGRRPPPLQSVSSAGDRGCLPAICWARSCSARRRCTCRTSTR